MKTCSNCGIEKTISEFHSRARKTGTYIYPQCKACHRRYVRDHYQKHKPDYLSKAQTRRSELLAVARAYLLPYLLSHPCVDCGETDVVVLQFDHCRGVKKAEISRLIRAGYTLETIMDEVAKCDVVCANCHVRRTAKQFGWWNADLAPVAQRKDAHAYEA